MKSYCVAFLLSASLVAVGCGRTENPADMGVGDASVTGGATGGTGGQGSGPTGTGGSEPADNPGADSPNDNGTGGP